jgi:hypothetical protein
MEFLKQFTAELFCSALVYDQLPQLAYILWLIPFAGMLGIYDFLSFRFVTIIFI